MFIWWIRCANLRCSEKIASSFSVCFFLWFDAHPMWHIRRLFLLCTICVLSSPAFSDFCWRWATIFHLLRTNRVPFRRYCVLFYLFSDKVVVFILLFSFKNQQQNKPLKNIQLNIDQVQRKLNQFFNKISMETLFKIGSATRVFVPSLTTIWCTFVAIRFCLS